MGPKKEETPRRGKRFLTPKGMATRAAILDRAHQVFKETGFYGSSISEITRQCKISMANFYQYFKNKEQIFLELNDLIISRFMSRAQELGAGDGPFTARLTRAIRLLVDHTRENFAFHRILGESQLIDRVTLAYYEAITRPYRDFFRSEARPGNIHSLDPNMLAYGLLGICYFQSLDWGEKGKPPSPEETISRITEFLLNGINGPAPWKRPTSTALLKMPRPVPLREEPGEPSTRGENTRQAIFRAAERVIGRKGINHANIADITREAGVAQGTFYIHFSSKRELIEGFVKDINYKMRRELQRAVASIQDRRDAERVGLLAFYQFLRQHRDIYRVVPECEMIDREVSLWYYKKIAQGYIQGLEYGIQRGEIRKFSPVFLTRALMGFTHFIALRWIVWDAQAEIPSQVFKDMIDFIHFGLKAR
jgi:AcrR family transcriptional regulator